MSSKLARQPLSSVMPALEPAVRIARDEDDTRRAGSWQILPNNCRRPAGEPAQTALLPGGHDRAQPVVVRQCRPRVRECEPPAGTLGTTLNRPGGRRAATLAEWRLDAAKRGCAAVAYLRSGEKAEETALRQEQIEHITTVGERV